MVLGALGTQLDEARLRRLTDCTPLGTDAFRLVEAARQLGFAHTRKHTLTSLDELTSLIDEGSFPIAYVDMWPLRGGLSGQHHSLVVVSVDSRNVTVLDPLVGERTVPREDFLAAWAAMRFLAIVVRA